MQSLWQATSQKPHLPTLGGDRKTDVLIVGGGIAGILLAYELTARGVDCLLCEADEICSHTTGHTTAKVTVQHGLLYDRTVRTFGKNKAQHYYDAQKKAFRRLRALAEEFPCDFETRDAWVYSLNDPKKIENEAAALRSLGCPAVFTRETPLPFEVAGAVGVPDQAQMHPLKLLYALALDLPIYEHTKIRHLLPDGAETDKGRIRAKRTVVTTHFPILNKHGAFFLKLYQSRSYVIALSGAEDVKGMYLDENEKGLSFRTHGGLLLLGGGTHRTGKAGGGWEPLLRFAKATYPRARVVGKWATQDCMTLDGLPYIGQYARPTPNLYVSTGYGKWGMTNAMASAMLLSDLLTGRENPGAALFSPSRSILKPQLFANAGEALLGLLTPTVKRCPHLGCALQYNPQEHTWDCSCHGSRFAPDGTLLDGPATDDHPKPLSSE